MALILIPYYNIIKQISRFSFCDIPYYISLYIIIIIVMQSYRILVKYKKYKIHKDLKNLKNLSAFYSFLVYFI